METQTQKAFYSVPGCNLATLLDRIEKLNKRCRKLGIPEIKATTEVDYTAHLYKNVKRNDATRWVPEVDLPTCETPWEPTGRVMDWHEVAIVGASPKLDGWRFIATLEPLAADDQTTMNLVMTVPGEDCPPTYMGAGFVGVCDHCQKTRNRKQTFVVQHEDGSHKVVGRSCIKDFLGHADPNHLASWAELLVALDGVAASAEEEGWLGGHYEAPRYDLEYYLGWIAGVTRNHGWVSRGRARQDWELCATVDRVNYLLKPPQFRETQDRIEWEAEVEKCKPTDVDKAAATDALEWGRSLDIDKLMEGDNSYLANVALVVKAGVATEKTYGLAGSIIAAYCRAKDKEIKIAEKAALPPSVHIGTVKERLDIKVRCERIIPRDGHYGTTYITKLLAWNNTHGSYADAVVWFASKLCMDEGLEYKIKATIKNHDEWQGNPQTVITRAKVL